MYLKAWENLKRTWVHDSLVCHGAPRYKPTSIAWVVCGWIFTTGYRECPVFQEMQDIYIYTSLQFAAAFFAFSRPANATYVSLRSMYLYLSLFLAFCRMFCFLLPSHTKSGLSGGQFDWHCFIAKTGEVRFLELQSNFDCQESTTKKTHLGMQIYTPVN